MKKNVLVGFKSYSSGEMKITFFEDGQKKVMKEPISQNKEDSAQHNMHNPTMGKVSVAAISQLFHAL